MALTRPRLLFLVTEDWYFWSHRLALARAARDAGMDVLVSTRVGDFGPRIEAEGFRLFPVEVRRAFGGPAAEWRSLKQIVRLYRSERPDIVHHVALKPIVLGSIAARLAGVPSVVNAFAGLGYLFTEGRSRPEAKRAVGILALRVAIRLARGRVVLQNDDDREELLRHGIVRKEKTVIIRGSGVDVARFTPAPEPAGVPLVVLPGRMLWDKGVAEFVEAARLLKRRGVSARFALVGPVDTENPVRIPESQLVEWCREGAVEWWGQKSEMAEIFRSARLVVLPSYREGLPKALLEAASCGRALVATDVPGCRDVVEDGINGLLIPARESAAVASAIERLLSDSTLRLAMGEKGRQMVLARFSEEQVTRETLALYSELLGGTAGSDRSFSSPD